VDASAHTAPHDELVDVVRELADHAPNNAVLIDTLARALKERGFSRPPGSPRLITRLRRIRELVVSRTGMITLADAAAGGEVAPPAEAEGADAEVDTLAEPSPGGETAPAAGAPRRSRRRRRRRRRGGGGGAPAPASVPA
jgi:hypothetical protein